ncbi:hypothetical protein AAFF_G00065880 [Aldrovandia affinis]|uniref:NADH dehydrogenase [ubiquinone] 1 alpha subcomplex subunit 12 n=1 Tax=Aldrovandia affinis TaxID=143900 RepID=A0AAD7T3Z2_9TELE|nr:hypothetical protein AAFF_G00065880 [Aldrovandia affinis]
MSRITSLFRRTFGIVKEHVGSDHFGNKYFFVPEQKTWTGRSLRAKRMVEPANPKEYEYLEGNIPSEWGMRGEGHGSTAIGWGRTWIRGRRKEPPTVEELLKNERYKEQIKHRALEVEQRDLALQAHEYEDGLVSRPAQTLIKGHASATHYGKAETSEEPVSTANTFQPGSWIPQGGKAPKR